jgi:predicted CopG family antitoxin
MAVKTVTLKLEAYERLRAARSYPGESFSEVVLRARWPEESVTGAQLLARYQQLDPAFTIEELDELESAITEQRARAPEDKWTTR